MGGRGSGSLPDEGSEHRGGRKKKAALAVVGSGLPVKPRGLDRETEEEWDWLVEVLSGVVFSQDSSLLLEMAQRGVIQRRLWELRIADLKDDNVDLQLNRNTMRLTTMWSQCGMTPRSRQILLVPTDEEERDELEQLMQGRE